MSGIQEIHISHRRYVRIQSANRLIGIAKGHKRKRVLDNESLYQPKSFSLKRALN